MWWFLISKKTWIDSIDESIEGARKNMSIKIAKRMIVKEYDVGDIAELTTLTREEINKLAESMKL